MTFLPEPSSVNSSSEEETQMGISEDDGEDDTEMGRDEGKRGESSSDEDVLESSRRSFSLDSSWGSKISLAVFKEYDESITDKQLEIDNNLRSASGGKRVGRKGKLQRMRSGSSNERSLLCGTVSMKRSVSCGGKFVLCRQIRSSDSILPLWSIREEGEYWG